VTTAAKSKYGRRMNTILPPATSLLPVADALPASLDPVALLLADKRSPATKWAYASDLAGFFKTLASDIKGR